MLRENQGLEGGMEASGLERCSTKQAERRLALREACAMPRSCKSFPISNLRDGRDGTPTPHRARISGRVLGALPAVPSMHRVAESAVCAKHARLARWPKRASSQQSRSCGMGAMGTPLPHRVGHLVAQAHSLCGRLLIPEAQAVSLRYWALVDTIACGLYAVGFCF